VKIKNFLEMILCNAVHKAERMQLEKQMNLGKDKQKQNTSNASRDYSGEVNI
jgi:hypothetical protein